MKEHVYNNNNFIKDGRLLRRKSDNVSLFLLIKIFYRVCAGMTNGQQRIKIIDIVDRKLLLFSELFVLIIFLE